jgi:muconolactone delta-isomerase
MRFMVTLTPKPDQGAAINQLLGAEQRRVAELRQAGVLEQLYVHRPGRAWLVLVADSAPEAHQIVASLPLHEHVEATIESLMG